MSQLSWSSPVNEIPGIGPKRADALKLSGIKTAGEMLKWMPRRYLDRSIITDIKEEARDG